MASASLHRTADSRHHRHLARSLVARETVGAAVGEGEHGHWRWGGVGGAIGRDAEPGDVACFPFSLLHNERKKTSEEGRSERRWKWKDDLRKPVHERKISDQIHQQHQFT